MRGWLPLIVGLLSGQVSAADGPNANLERHLPAPEGCSRTGGLRNNRVVIKVGCSVQTAENMTLHQAGFDATLVLEHATKVSLFCKAHDIVVPGADIQKVLREFEVCHSGRLPPKGRYEASVFGLPFTRRSLSPAAEEDVSVAPGERAALKLTVTVTRWAHSSQVQVNQFRESLIEDLLKGVDTTALQDAARGH